MSDLMQALEDVEYTDYKGVSHRFIDLVEIDSNCDTKDVIREIFRAGVIFGELCELKRRLDRLDIEDHPVRKLLG